MAGILYLVQDGDTLADIAQAQCGDASLAGALAATNHIADPNTIYAGTNLIIDCDALRGGAPTGPIPSTVPTGNMYLIQPGDTLASIAQSQCGDASLADALAALNRIEDVNMIYAGANLIIDCRALVAWHPEMPPFTPGPNTDGTYG